MNRQFSRGTIWIRRVLPYFLLIVSLLAAPVQNSVGAMPVAANDAASAVAAPLAAPAIRNISDNQASYPNSQVPTYQKLELTFQVDTSAANVQMPFDPNPPAGVQAGQGISVDVFFTPDNWATTYTQPAFFYQGYDDQVKSGREWFYPNGANAWKVRFAPDRPGTWQYKIRAQDASGVSESGVGSFTAGPATTRGPIKVSSRDSRYFEFSDGTYFPAMGYNMNYDHVSWTNPTLGNEGNFAKMSQNGIQLARIWLSQWAIWGSAWNGWQSIEPELHGWYIPYNGMNNRVAYGSSQVSMELDASWDPCMFMGFVQSAPAVKANTNYRVRVRYRTENIAGPRVAGKPYGFTVKMGDWLYGNNSTCQEPGTGVVVAPYQPQNTGDWQTLEGSLNSGNNNFLPFFYLVLENVNAGNAFIDYVWIEENLGNGQYGPNIVAKPWMAHHQYFDQRNSYAFDKVVNLAEKYGVYLRPVVMEKNEFIGTHFDFQGNPVFDDQRCADNDSGNDPATCPSNEWFYGNWDQPTMVRWYQQAWWRYLQARWGYSQAIHSWELLNEGDPYSGTHYTLANEFGKFIKQYKPNDRLVSTSFWHSFPKNEFWANSAYSAIDFADIHHYIPENDALFNDSAQATYQVSMQFGAKQSGGAGKPVIRGETGFTVSSTEPGSPQLDADTQGIWLHKFVWAGINPGGMIESNWYENQHIYRVSNGQYVFDHRPIFGKYYNFIKDIPLSNGSYVDAQAATNNANLVAWGQKDLQNGRAHLWINNKLHTWKAVVNRASIAPQTGTVRVSGFRAGAAYTVQWIDTYQTDPARQVTRTDTITAGSDGSINLNVANLTTDVAVKIAQSGGGAPNPTAVPPTAVPPTAAPTKPAPTSVVPTTVAPTAIAPTAVQPTPTKPAAGGEAVNPGSITALAAGTNVLLDFNNIASPTDGRALNAYSGLTWSGLVEGSPWAGINTWNFYIANNGTQGTITFPRPVVIKSLTVSSQGSNSFTLSSAGNADVSAATSGGAPKTLTTNWTNPVTSLTIRANNSDQVMDDLRFTVAGAGNPAPTSVPPTATATFLPIVTKTPVAPTATAVQPTTVPPTPTAVQPTAAPVQPTAVPVQPTAAPVQPTAAVPTQPPSGGDVVNPANINSLAAGTNVLLDFNNITSPTDGRSLNTYGGLTWTSLVEGSPWAGVKTWNFYIANNGTQGTITFPRPVVLKSLLVSAQNNNTYTLSSPGLPNVSVSVSKHVPKTVVTNWSSPITSLTIRATSKDQVLDDLRFTIAGGASPSPTQVNPTATKAAATATKVAPTVVPPTATKPAQLTATATATFLPIVTATATPTRPAPTSAPPTQPAPGGEALNPGSITSLAAGTNVLFNFNNITSPTDGRALNNYGGLTWSGLVEGSPWAGIGTWNFYIANNGTQGTITFPRPVVVKSLVVSSQGNNVFTLLSAGNADVSVATSNGSPKTLATNWTNPVTSLTIRANNSDQVMDDLRFSVAGAGSPAPTSVGPTSVAPTATRPAPTSVAPTPVPPQPTAVVPQPTVVVPQPTVVVPPPVGGSEPNAWPMAGANPQRTSWSPEEVRGRLNPVWYRPVEPYIQPNTQLVAANGLIYVSTASGLYALDAETGAQRWVFGTEMPLGNAPTIVNGVAYVGGYDRKLYALHATTGQLLWSYSGAGAGFSTNPLVVNNMVYLGNRDGYFYAIYSNDHASKGQLAWRFNAGSPINFSAASDRGNTTLYFATDNAYGYALNAMTGAQVWRTDKLPGAGFRSWWPVVYQNKVMFVGTTPYRLAPPFGAGDKDLQNLDGDSYFSNIGGPDIGPRSGMQVDATSLSKYLSDNPWRRTYFVIDAASGKETTYDFNGDGKGDFAPVAWYGTRSGSRYPPIVAGKLPSGTDTRLIYQSNTFLKTTNGTRGQVAGWKIGTPNIVTPRSGTGVPTTNNTNASDEPVAYSSGGDVIYWNLCCDREAGSFTIDGANQWQYWSYNLDSLVPGYDSMYWGEAESGLNKLFGTFNGVYGEHGDNNAPVPYKGKVYMVRSNAIIAMGLSGGSSDHSLVRKPSTVNPANANPTTAQLQQQLSAEVEKMLQAGHLRPGYGMAGNADGTLNKGVGDRLHDYWHNTADTLIVLTQALPYLPAEQQARVKTYLTNEITKYPPYQYAHNGWDTGAPRESYLLPPEVTLAMTSFRATDWIEFSGWNYPPYIFYGLWKYAQVNPSQAAALFNASRSRLQSPNTAAFADLPYLHNAWIAGYKGYVELAKLAGNTAEANAKQATLDQLMASRAANFNKDILNTSDTPNQYFHVLSISRNFLYMTPELGQYLNANASAKVQAAMQEYTRIAPYWFVSKFGATYGEGAVQPLHDVNALFSTKAWVLREPRSELVKYIDVPGVEVGDLYYIQNLVMALQAQ